jgi:hypothetical protein
VLQAERPSGKRLLVPAAASLSYQPALAQANPLQFLDVLFATFGVEVLAAVALACVVAGIAAAAQV